MGAILLVSGLWLSGIFGMAAVPTQSAARGKTVTTSVRRESPILMPMKTIGRVQKAKYEITVSNNGDVPFDFRLISYLSGELPRCGSPKPLEKGSGTWTVKTGGAYEEGWRKDKYTASESEYGSLGVSGRVKPGDSMKFHVTVIPSDNAKPGVTNTLQHRVVVSGVENPRSCKDITIGKPVPGLKVAFLTVAAAGAAAIGYPFAAGLY